MKKILFILFISLCYISGIAQSVKITGTQFIEVIPEASSGLSAVYVLRDASTAKISYTSRNSNVLWQRYSNLGGGYAEDITDVTHSNNEYSINANSSDMGYIITDGNRQTCLWVVNYATYDNVDINTLEAVSSDCNSVILRVDDSAECIAYYTITGRREVLDREFKLKYNTLEYSETDGIYNQISKEETLPWFDNEISTDVPLCDTEFILTSDRFASEWSGGEEVISSTFQTSAVQAQTSATQTLREADNEQKVESELGGSAPCEITFKAAVTDAAIYRRWEISTYPDFNEVDLLFTDLEVIHTFNDAGTTYVRFVSNNAEGTCEYIGDTYTISIGDSRLECPNAFSPGASEGVNDLWKVSYRSIISFNCQIFNRWGQKIIELTDPSQSWDGTYKGKLVKSGTYFYVIKARGADNKDYELSGHINIMETGNNPTGSGSAEDDFPVME